MDTTTDTKLSVALVRTLEESSHFHQSLEILFLLQGSVSVALQGESFVMHKNDVLVINSGFFHSLQGGTDLLMLQLEISRQMVEDLFPGKHPYFHCNSALDFHHPYGELRQLIRKLLLSYREETPSPISLRYSLAYQILGILQHQFLGKEPEKDAAGKGKDTKKIQAVMDYVNQNYDSSIHLGKLAEQLFMSTSSLSRLFKKETGCYFADYVNQVRMQHAVSELENTDKSITRIAGDCGFSNPASFQKLFQSIYQCSPSIYRKEKQHRLQIQINQLKQLKEELQQLPLEETLSFTPDDPALSIHIPAIRGTPFKQSWNQVLNGGAVSDLGIYQVQQHIVSLYQQLHFSYLRVWNIFSKSMMILQNSTDRRYNFSKLDAILDFLVEHKILPYLDFGQRPNCAVKSEGEMVFYEDEEFVFQNADDWARLFLAFTDHIIQRYGRNEVNHWIFDFTVDIRNQTLPFCSSQEEMWELYRRFFTYLRQNLPEAKIGGLGSIPVGDLSPITDWLEYCKENHCVPHHLSVLIFPYVHERQGDYYGPHRNAREGEEGRQVRLCRELLDRMGLRNCQLFVVEWNNTLSTRNWLNDSCARGTYLLHTLNDTWDIPDVMGIWMATDLVSSYYDTFRIAHGGNGILSKDGIKKPACHALNFLNRMNTWLIKRGEQYIATTSGPNHIYVLCYNHKPYSYQYYQCPEDQLNLKDLSPMFANQDPLHLHFKITGLSESGTYALKRRRVNDEHGSLLGLWSRFEFDANLDARDIQYLQSMCLPELTMKKVQIERGSLEFDVHLQPHEFVLFHIFEA
jgi:xylan 1,4-beta-xylosidase